MIVLGTWSLGTPYMHGCESVQAHLVPDTCKIPGDMVSVGSHRGVKLKYFG